MFDMKRREFITLIGGAAVAWPVVARAQQPDPMRRIGVLMNLTADDPEAPGRVAANTGSRQIIRQAYDDSASSNALASFRSGVSKPSVNQP